MTIPAIPPPETATDPAGNTPLLFESLPGVGFEGGALIRPDCMTLDIKLSALVRTVTAPPEVAAPKVSPATTTTTEDATGIPVWRGKMIEEEPSNAPVTVCELISAFKTALELTTKNPTGNETVIWAPIPMAPPGEVLKITIALTGVCPATMLSAEIMKDDKLTAPPTAPEDTAFEGNTSALVCTVTAPPAVAAPSVRLDTVTDAETFAGILKTENTIWELPKNAP